MGGWEIQRYGKRKGKKRIDLVLHAFSHPVVELRQVDGRFARESSV